MDSKMSYVKTEKYVGFFDSSLKTVPDYLYFHYKNTPDKDAIVFASEGGSRESVTFKDLYENACHVAKRFIKLGVQQSDVVAVSMRTSPKWLYAFFGAVLAGARPIPLSFTYSDGSDVIAMMKKLQTCSLIVLDPGEEEETWNIFTKIVDSYDNSGGVRSEMMPYLRYLVCHERPRNNYQVLTLDNLMAWEISEPTLPEVSPDDVFFLIQTSGSTGVPKAVTHSHKSFIAAIRTFSEVQRFRNDDIIYCDRPFTWIGGFPITVVNGQTRVTISGYCQQPEDPVEFLIDVIKRERCDTMLILPPMLHKLILRQNELGSDWPLQTILTGGQPIFQEFARYIGKVCKNFICLYGSAEYMFCTTMYVQAPENFEDYLIGYPLQGFEIKIVDDDGNVVPIGERGEIHVKVESLFLGYYNDPMKTKAVVTEDGWFKSDDIGMMNENGKMFCYGRKSDMILSGGMNVTPSILEAVIQSCPGVARAVCVPVPHEVMFQVICACIQKKDGSDVKEADVRSFCTTTHNDKPGLFTVLPEYYLFLHQFPQTYSGKTARKELAKIAVEKFAKS